MCPNKDELPLDKDQKTDLIKKDTSADSNQKIPLNAGGVVRYYQDFVFSFLSDLNLIVSNLLVTVNQQKYSFHFVSCSSIGFVA